MTSWSGWKRDDKGANENVCNGRDHYHDVGDGPTVHIYSEYISHI